MEVPWAFDKTQFGKISIIPPLRIHRVVKFDKVTRCSTLRFK